MKKPGVAEKRTFGRVDGEIVFYGQLAPEDAALVGCAHWPFDLSLDVGKVGLINYHFHAYLHRSRPTIRTLLDALLHLLGNTHTHLVIHFCYSIIITQPTPCIYTGINYALPKWFRNDVLWRSVEALLEDGLLRLVVAETALVVFWLLVRQVLLLLLLQHLHFLRTVLRHLIDGVGCALADSLRGSVGLLVDCERFEVENLRFVFDE